MEISQEKLQHTAGFSAKSDAEEGKAMYTFNSRVRYSETDEKGRLSVIGIMNYFQDCSTFQSEDLHMGLSHLKGARRAWWLNYWHIEIKRYPLLGEKICISTWPYNFKGIYGFRNFLLQDESGDAVVLADSKWIFYDLEHGCPARVTPEEINGYGQCETPLSMPKSRGRIILPDGCEEREPVTVSRHHLDTNLHVNNAQYVEIARECLPETFETGELLAEYRKAAVLGDEIIPKIYRAEDGYMVSLTGRDGQQYASLYLKEKRQDPKAKERAD